MAKSGRHQGWQALTVAALLFALLLSLLPQYDHSGLDMACPLLVMVFLFRKIDARSRFWRLSLSSTPAISQSPILPSRFQRPPPDLL
jgi:hypothetical protein